GWAYASGYVERQLGHGPATPAARMAGPGTAGCAVPAGDEGGGRGVPDRRGSRPGVRGGRMGRRSLERGGDPLPDRCRRGLPRLPRPARLGGRTRGGRARAAGTTPAPRGAGDRRLLWPATGVVGVR